MDVNFNKRENVIICSVSGEVDMYAAPEFHEKYRTMSSKEGGCSFVFDLEKTTYMDSSGIGVLFQIFSDVKTRGAGFCICNATGMVEKLFKLSRMTAILPIEKNIDFAIERVKGNV